MNDITSKKYSLYSKKFLDRLRFLIKTKIADNSAYMSGTESKSLKVLFVNPILIESVKVD